MDSPPLRSLTARIGFLRSREALAVSAVAAIALYILVFGTLFWLLWRPG